MLSGLVIFIKNFDSSTIGDLEHPNNNALQ